MPSSDLLQQACSPIVEFAVGCLLRLHIVFLTLVSDLPLDALEGVIQLPSAAIGVVVHAAALHTHFVQELIRRTLQSCQFGVVALLLGGLAGALFWHSCCQH